MDFESIAKSASIGAAWYLNERDRGSYTKNCSRSYLAAYLRAKGVIVLPKSYKVVDELKLVHVLYQIIGEPIIIYRCRSYNLAYSDGVIYKLSIFGERIDEGNHLLDTYLNGF